MRYNSVNYGAQTRDSLAKFFLTASGYARNAENFAAANIKTYVFYGKRAVVRLNAEITNFK